MLSVDINYVLDGIRRISISAVSMFDGRPSYMDDENEDSTIQPQGGTVTFDTFVGSTGHSEDDELDMTSLTTDTEKTSVDASYGDIAYTNKRDESGYEGCFDGYEGSFDDQGSFDGSAADDMINDDKNDNIFQERNKKQRTGSFEEDTKILPTKICEIEECKYHLLPAKIGDRYRTSSSAYLLVGHKSGKYYNGGNKVCEHCYGDIKSEVRKENKRKPKETVQESEAREGSRRRLKR